MAVYVIGPVERGGPYKIGHSADVEKRLCQLQIGSPVPLEIKTVFNGNKDLEGLLHWIFQAKRTHGEWFALGGRELALLTVMVTEGVKESTQIISDYLEVVMEEDPLGNIDLIVEFAVKGIHVHSG